jgi:uncharacterized protein
MSKPKNRLEEIAHFADEYLQHSYRKRKDKAVLKRFLSGYDYRWAHTLRVAQYGKLIGEAENMDPELVICACLLHDIAWFDVDWEHSREHGFLGARIARPILENLDYSEEEVENICYSIASHVTVENPETLESKVVSDADNVDRYGPYRVLQWCFSDINDYEKLAEKLNDRIQRLEQYREKNPLFTETGRHLFAEQLHLQILFFSEFVGEQRLTVPPQI